MTAWFRPYIISTAMFQGRTSCTNTKFMCLGRARLDCSFNRLVVAEKRRVGNVPLFSLFLAFLGDGDSD